MNSRILQMNGWDPADPELAELLSVLNGHWHEAAIVHYCSLLRRVMLSWRASVHSAADRHGAAQDPVCLETRGSHHVSVDAC